MTPLSRKQREIRERDELIRDVARRMLLERGYLGLTMDRIAKEIEYSKGTVYQHFRSKEDLVVALATETAHKRAELFERASLFRGRPRERLWAVGIAYELFVRLYPAHFHSERLIHAASIREKAAERRDEILEDCEERCGQVVAGILRDAIAAGDLELPSGEDGTPQSAVMGLSFNLWALSFGSFFLISTGAPLIRKGVADPLAALRRGYERILDGYGMRPLTNEWDYDATLERVRNEVFPEESRRLAELGG